MTTYVLCRILNYQQYGYTITPIGSFTDQAEADGWCDRLRRAASTFVSVNRIDTNFLLPDQEARYAASLAALKRIDPDAPDGDQGMWYTVLAADPFVVPTEAEPANALEELYWSASAAAP